MHALVGFERLRHKSWIAKQIHHGLTIQKNDPSQVKFDLAPMRLLEELCNWRFELIDHLCKLEATTHFKLEVLIFF
jgi:hypothetical protein